MKHQPEIDGLRALAILPVLAYHVGAPGVSGGFAGVDLFFVISGYLITTILRDELAAGRFSVLEFYKRRALRILPALSVVLLAVSGVALLVFMPAELREVGRSATAAALFFSNVFFWMGAGYFDAAAEAKPLLHTWSLSVEEQFYIGFPLLLAFLARRFPGKAAATILVLTAASFVVSAAAVHLAPVWAFYLLPSRAWELGIGALLALYPVPPLHRWRSLLSALGLGLVLGAIAGLSPTSTFPGYNALLPCLGAALLIAFGPGTPAGRLLATPALVWVGLISYSLYLWHWPLIVFYKARYGAELSRADMMLLALASIALAALSYYFVERPFRTRVVRRWPARSAVAGGATVVLAFSVAGLLLSTHGTRMRSYPPEVLAASRLADYRSTPEYKAQFRAGQCFLGQAETFDAFDKTQCLTPAPGKKNYVLVGDSHAAQIWRALQDRFPTVNFLQATASGCRPVLDGGGGRRCTDLIQWVMGDYLARNRIEGVALAARWDRADLPRLLATVRALQDRGLDVIVFGPTVEYKGGLPQLFGHSVLNNRAFDAQEYVVASKKALSDEMRDLLSGTGARYFPIYDQICSNAGCMLRTPDGELMQFDYGHLTLTASRLVVDRLATRPEMPLQLH